MSAFAAAVSRFFAGKRPPIAYASSSLRLSAAPVAFRVHVGPFLFLAVRKSSIATQFSFLQKQEVVVVTNHSQNMLVHRPTVSLALISLVASSCGYYTGQIEHRAAQ
jgi:hypothetical protein